MDKKERIMVLKMALSCLRRDGDERPIFSLDFPDASDISQIKRALETGDIDEKILAKFFPMAYRGAIENGFFEYFFNIHNSAIRCLERYTKSKLVDWCTAYPAEIVGIKGSKFVVHTVDERSVEADNEVYPGIKVENSLKIADKVALHRDKIHMALSEEDYAKACQAYSRFKRQNIQ